MELCLLFVNKKEIRIKQVRKFLFSILFRNESIFPLFRWQNFFWDYVRIIQPI